MRIGAPVLAFTLVVVGWTTGPAGAAGWRPVSGSYAFS
jgi:hypothetical protein